MCACISRYAGGLFAEIAQKHGLMVGVDIYGQSKPYSNPNTCAHRAVLKLLSC